MPLYEFECPLGHRFEQILPLHLSEIARREGVFCFKIKDDGNICEEKAEKLWSIPANINIGKPTIIFRNSKNPNDVEVATHDNDATPYGFVKEELRNPIERSKFEKERNNVLDLQNQIITEERKLRDAATRKARHDDINSRMSSIPDDGTREFLKESMKLSREKRDKVKKSSVRLDVNHFNKSNLIPS